MNQDLPQVRTVKLLFVAMDEQQQAMFKMAFKMHSTTNYQVLDASTEKPELVIVDCDGVDGLGRWQKAKGDFQNAVVVYFAKTPPAVTAPYLPKPIKFDTLFVNLRSLSQGNGVWVPQTAHHAAAHRVPSAETGQASVKSHGYARTDEVSVSRFNPDTGLLGVFKKVAAGQDDTIISVDGKPILSVFPSTQRVWISVDSATLQHICRQDKLEIQLQAITSGSGQEKANATVLSSMWQIALWTANGRLIQPINQNTVFKLKFWPNLTRLASLPESMRLSAFLIKTPVSLNMLYKLLPLDMKDILNFIAATYMTDYLEVTKQTDSPIEDERVITRHEAGNIDDRTVANQEPEHSSDVAVKQPQSGGLLSRLMKKLLNK